MCYVAAEFSLGFQVHVLSLYRTCQRKPLLSLRYYNWHDSYQNSWVMDLRQVLFQITQSKLHTKVCMPDSEICNRERGSCLLNTVTITRSIYCLTAINLIIIVECKGEWRLREKGLTLSHLMGCLDLPSGARRMERTGA